MDPSISHFTPQALYCILMKSLPSALISVASSHASCSTASTDVGSFAQPVGAIIRRGHQNIGNISHTLLFVLSAHGTLGVLQRASTPTCTAGPCETGPNSARPQDHCMIRQVLNIQRRLKLVPHRPTSCSVQRHQQTPAWTIYNFAQLHRIGKIRCYFPYHSFPLKRRHGKFGVSHGFRPSALCHCLGHHLSKAVLLFGVKLCFCSGYISSML